MRDVGAGRRVVEQHPVEAHLQLAVVAQHPNLHGDLAVRQPVIVRLAEGDIPARAGGEAVLHVAQHAEIVRPGPHRDPLRVARPVALDDLRGAVGGLVVADHDLQPEQPALAQHRVEAAADIGGVVVGRDDDADRELLHEPRAQGVGVAGERLGGVEAHIVQGRPGDVGVGVDQAPEARHVLLVEIGLGQPSEDRLLRGLVARRVAAAEMAAQLAEERDLGVAELLVAGELGGVGRPHPGGVLAVDRHHIRQEADAPDLGVHQVDVPVAGGDALVEHERLLAVVAPAVEHAVGLDEVVRHEVRQRRLRAALLRVQLVDPRHVLVDDAHPVEAEGEFRARPQEIDLPLELARVGPVIVALADRHELAAGARCEVGEIPVRPEILAAQDRHEVGVARGVLGDDLGSPVRGSVVADQQLEGEIRGLAKDALQRLPDEGRLVVADAQDRDDRPVPRRRGLGLGARPDPGREGIDEAAVEGLVRRRGEVGPGPAPEPGAVLHVVLEGRQVGEADIGIARRVADMVEQAAGVDRGEVVLPRLERGCDLSCTVLHRSDPLNAR